MTTPTAFPNLNPRHIEELVVKRGISPDFLRKNYQSMSQWDAKEFLGYNPGSDGYATIGSNGQKQFKPDTLFVDKNGDTAKYLTPKGSNYDAQLPHWVDEWNSDIWAMNEFPEGTLYKKDGKTYVLITEGLHKAVYGCMHSLATIALMGVDMGLSGKDNDPEGKKYLVKSIQRTLSKVDGVIIVFDADAATKVEVRHACKTLGDAIERQGKLVLTATGLWDAQDGKGMDDYIQNKGIEAFREKLLQSVPLSQWKEENKTTKTKKKDDSLSPVGLGQMLAPDYREHYAYHNEQSTWRHFNGKIWERVNEKQFKATVYHELKGRNVSLKSPSQYIGAVETLECELLVSEWKALDRKRYIAFNDVVYDTIEKKTEEYKPGFRFLNKLPYDYAKVDVNHDAVIALKEHCPNVHWLFDHAMNGDPKRIKRLLAILNAIVTWKFFDLQMFVFLTGKSGAGKGTFMRLASKMIGDVNHHGTTMANLNKGTTRAKIIDRQLVTCPDERKKIGIDDLLSLTGGDKIEYEEKYCPSASSYFYGTIMIASNSPLFIGDTTGIDRRQCLVHFDTPIPAEKRNSRSEELYDQEISKLVMVVLSMSEKEVEDSIRGRGDDEIPSAVYYDWENKVRTDSIAAFIDDEIVRTPGSTFEMVVGDRREPDDKSDKSHLNTLFGRYSDYCKRTGMEAKKLQNFSGDFLNIINDHLGWGADKKRTNKGYRIVGEVRLRESAFDDGCLRHSENLHLFMMGTEESFASKPTQSAQALPDKDSGSTLEPALGLHEVCTIENNAHPTDSNESISTEECIPECRPNVDRSVYLKPLPSKESVDCAGLSDENSLSDGTEARVEKVERPQWSYELSLYDKVYVIEPDFKRLYGNEYPVVVMTEDGVTLALNKAGSRMYLMWNQVSPIDPKSNSKK